MTFWYIGQAMKNERRSVWLWLWIVFSVLWALFFFVVAIFVFIEEKDIGSSLVLLIGAFAVPMLVYGLGKAIAWTNRGFVDKG